MRVVMRVASREGDVRNGGVRGREARLGAEMARRLTCLAHGSFIAHVTMHVRMHPTPPPVPPFAFTAFSRTMSLTASRTRSTTVGSTTCTTMTSSPTRTCRRFACAPSPPTRRRALPIPPTTRNPQLTAHRRPLPLTAAHRRPPPPTAAALCRAGSPLERCGRHQHRRFLSAGRASLCQPLRLRRLHRVVPGERDPTASHARWQVRVQVLFDCGERDDFTRVN